MSKSSLLLLAAALAFFGSAVIAGHPPWGAVTGTAILLTAAGLAAGALVGGSAREEDLSEQRASGQKISGSLVTLSATAILAVYAAGYQRTRTAGDTFEGQTARRQSATPATVVIPLPPVTVQPLGAASAPAAPRSANAAAAEAPVAPSKAKPKPATPAAPPAVANATAPPAPVAAPNPPAAESNVPAAVKQQVAYKDGTFFGWGRCRHGTIQASVSIQGGQIVTTEIAQCLTRYSCAWIENLPGQVVTRQSANVDYVTGATESTEAFYDAVASALASAHE